MDGNRGGLKGVTGRAVGLAHHVTHQQDANYKLFSFGSIALPPLAASIRGYMVARSRWHFNVISIARRDLTFSWPSHIIHSDCTKQLKNSVAQYCPCCANTPTSTPRQKSIEWFLHFVFRRRTSQNNVVKNESVVLKHIMHPYSLKSGALLMRALAARVWMKAPMSSTSTAEIRTWSPRVFRTSRSVEWSLPTWLWCGRAAMASSSAAPPRWTKGLLVRLRHVVIHTLPRARRGSLSLLLTRVEALLL